MLQVHLVLKVQEDQQVDKVLKEVQGLLVLQVHKEVQVQQDRKDQQDLLQLKLVH